MAGNGQVALKGNSPMSRQLVQLASMRLRELTKPALDFVARVMGDPDQKTSDRLLAARLILERTIPTVQSVRVHASAEVHSGESFDWSELAREAMEIVGANGADGRVH